MHIIIYVDNKTQMLKVVKDGDMDVYIYYIAMHLYVFTIFSNAMIS